MRRVEHVMGFPVSLRVDDEGFAEWGAQATDTVFAWLREADARFSPFRPDRRRAAGLPYSGASGGRLSC